MQHTALVAGKTHEQRVVELAKRRVLIRARELDEHSIPTAVLGRLVAAGKLQRVSRGVYSLPERAFGEHHSFAEAALRVPQGVVCLLSALRLHEIGTQAPHEVWLAVPNNVPTPRVEQPPLRVIRMTGDALGTGIQERTIDGIKVKLFSPAKTIADCFKFRNKVGLDVALEALRAGWADRKFSMDELWRCAAVDRVTTVMRPYLEALAS